MLDTQVLLNNMNNLLQIKIFETSLSKFLIAFGIIFTILILKKFIKKILIKNIKFLINSKILSDNIIKSIDKPLGFLILILGFLQPQVFLKPKVKLRDFLKI